MSQKAQGQQPFPPPTSICEQLVVLFFKTCFAASLLSWGWFHTKSSVVLTSCGWCSGVGVTSFVWGVVNLNPNRSVSQKNEAAVLFLVLIVCPHQQIVIKVCNQDMNHIVTVGFKLGHKDQHVWLCSLSSIRVQSRNKMCFKLVHKARRTKYIWHITPLYIQSFMLLTWSPDRTFSGLLWHNHSKGSVILETKLFNLNSSLILLYHSHISVYQCIYNVGSFDCHEQYSTCCVTMFIADAFLNV